MILPEWITALALASCPFSLFLVGTVLLGQPIDAEATRPLGYLGLFIGCAWLSAAIFGKEHQFGTMEHLMALPTTRRHLWLSKSGIALIAVGSAIIAYLVSIHFVDRAHARMPFLADARSERLHFLFICTLGPGLLFSVFLRRFQEAFWLTLLAPIALLLGIANLVGTAPATVQENAFSYTMAIYGIGSLLLAWKATSGWQATRLHNRIVIFSLPQILSLSRSQATSQLTSSLL